MTAPIDGTGQSAGTGGQSAAGTDGTAAGTAVTGTAGQSTAATDQAAQTAATVSRADFEALQRQLSAADQNRVRAEQEAKTLRDASLSEDEKRKQDLEQAKADLQKRDEDIKLLRLQNAFITDNTYDWHDPKAALKLADLSAVTVDDAGTVKGLKEALKAVAEANPWMVKPKSAEETPAAESGATGGSTGITGQGSSGANSRATDKATLEKRFPQLRGRSS